MFYGCTGLTEAPDLPATTLASFCYNSMFYNCTALTEAPDLPATTLESSCYSSMFYGCAALKTLPELPATYLPGSCYSAMFRNAYAIKLSETQTGKYTIPYRLPASGSGTTESGALSNMFTGTSGTFTSTPTIDTTYYLWDYEEASA